MKNRSTLVLLITIAVLGIFIWLQESRRARVPSTAIRQIRLFDIDLQTLSSIEFINSNRTTRVFSQSGAWSVGEPGTGRMGRADAGLVHQTVFGINSIGKGTTISEKDLKIRGFDASEYGFNPPVAEISVVDNHGARRWMVGRHTPLGNMIYVKMESSDDIYTVMDRLLKIIPSGSDVLRDRVLFQGEPVSTRQIEIRGSAGFIQLVKDPEIGWRLLQPVSAQGDSQIIDDLIGKLYRLRIEDFVADQVSDFSVYGLQGEQRQISLGGGEDASCMLVVGDDVPDQPGFVYVRRADESSVFTVRAEVLQLLDMPAERFRDVSVVPMDLEDISFISISHNSETLVFEKATKSSEWKIISPVEWPADAYAVEQLIRLWLGAVVTDFDVSPSVDSAEWILEFGSTETAVTNRLEVYPTKGIMDGLLVYLDGNSDCFKINLPELPKSLIAPLNYRHNRVLELDRKDIGRITVMTLDGAQQAVELLEGNLFSPAETNGHVRVDTIAAELLLDQLTQLDAEEYVAYNPQNLEIYGLDKPAFQIHVELSISNELGRVLLIGHKTADGYYSMIKGRDVVFYLAPEVVNTLSENLLIPIQSSSDLID
ncbi:MAG TPA: DUF4340 domain-containing protein [Pontiella sp.]